MACTPGMSLYCTRILHAKLGSFGEEEKKRLCSPLVTFADKKMEIFL